ncbi:MAG: HDOD domain-containing protein [Planctomycetaceae bacterium]|nr:HDOD domain-containing protein [Planctomycetaceae bacterium]
MRGLNLEQVLNMIRGLPSLPETHLRVMEVAQDSRASVTDLARVINTDTGLAARVLQVANTPFYGMKGRIETVVRGAVILGTKTIYSLALGHGVMEVLKQSDPRQECGIDVWKHSLQTAIAARELALHNGTIDSDAAFTGGLLHDMGKLVLATMFPEAYRSILEEHAASCTPLTQLERQFFGIDHPATGAYLCGQWKLPQTLLHIVAEHHDGLSSQSEYSVVAAANVLARLVSPHASGEVHVSIGELQSLLQNKGRHPLLRRLIVSHSMQAPRSVSGESMSVGNDECSEHTVVVDIENSMIAECISLICLACGATPVMSAHLNGRGTGRTFSHAGLVLTDRCLPDSENHVVRIDRFLTRTSENLWLNVAALHRLLLLSDATADLSINQSPETDRVPTDCVPEVRRVHHETSSTAT